MAGKGAAPLNPKSEIANPKSTRAVVIGISDYQDEQIPDLRFTDRDAEAFAQWLRSPADGSLPDNQIKVLTNKNATTGKMIAALDRLIVAGKPDGEAIIYFTGHGEYIEELCRSDYERMNFTRKLYEKDGQVYWSFGKHKDQLVSETKEYAMWVLGSDFPHETKKQLRRLLGMANC